MDLMFITVTHAELCSESRVLDSHARERDVDYVSDDDPFSISGTL